MHSSEFAKRDGTKESRLTVRRSLSASLRNLSKEAFLMGINHFRI
ncbi:hypothetical protein CHCC14809_1862 [Bacillus licheniformis]|nr:hypothetical protein MUY_001777 [Bacillus licheniformis WX-02]KYC70156.1 hypothetical protein B4092_1842 [Bacillus licheniformis]KYC75160.1 hypothetical protein B4090_1846 [Bacillus licheniformis]TWK02413.1 hypothetical protein CHCC20442_3692 [Bacillus licheniformis]TWK34048.1 hypothetical protein CHCC20368_0530 [Bacillus licheniformis]